MAECRPRPMFTTALAAGAGLVLAHWGGIPWDWMAWTALLFLIALILSRRSSYNGWFTLPAVLCAFYVWGFADYHVRAPDDLSMVAQRIPGSQQLLVRIIDPPEPSTTRSGNVRQLLTAEVLQVRTAEGWQAASGQLIISWQAENPGIAHGTTGRISGYLERPAKPRNPGGLDYGAYLWVRHIDWLFRADPQSWVQEQQGPRWTPLAMAHRLRIHMKEMLSLGVEDDPRIVALMSGMLFGHREGMGEELEEAFRVTGTLHVFAVSGQNVAVILGMMLLLMQVGGVLPWRWGWLVMPVLIIFCLSTGLEASAYRALVMASIALIGCALQRPISPLNILGAAALFIWVEDPRQIFDIGFQMSFGVVLSLALLTPPAYHKLCSLGEPDPWVPKACVPPWRKDFFALHKTLSALLAASVAAWVGSMPLTLIYFNLFAPITLLANMIVVPLAGCVVVLSAASVALGMISSLFAVLINQVNWLILHVIVISVTWLANVPGGYFYVRFGWPSLPESHARLTVLHSAQAMPAILETGGGDWLWDPGSEATWRHAINPLRRRMGVNHWDGLVTARGGTRSIGSAIVIAQTTPVGLWIDNGFTSRSPANKALTAYLAENNLGRRFWRANDTWRSGHITGHVLWPEPDSESFTRTEDRGLVVLLHGPGGGRVLWASGISSAVEQRLIKTWGTQLSADVLIQSEHSTALNLSRAWLEAVRPAHLIRPPRGFQPDLSLNQEFWQSLRDLDIELRWLQSSNAQIIEWSPRALHVHEWGKAGAAH